MIAPRDQALRRIAIRAAAGAEQLPVAARAQLFSDLSHILPDEEAQAARDLSVYLTKTEQLQGDFFARLK